MPAETTIEWATHSWNPTRGCSRVSAGCEHCYAEALAARFSKPGQWGHGFAEMRHGRPRWTGRVALQPQLLGWPLGSRKGGRRIFVNSTSDLFHEALPDESIAAVWGVMAACPGDDFLILTKRAERMRRWFEWLMGEGALTDGSVAGDCGVYSIRASVSLPISVLASIDAPWPLPNVHVGVSVEDQATADERIPHLRACPAAVRWISLEPQLEDVRLDLDRISWVVCGSESGPRSCSIGVIQ